MYAIRSYYAVGPYAPIALDPATAVLHYAQEIFEGLKAYAQADGGIALFRPEANAARFNNSARRLAMPELPEEVFVESIRQLVAADRDWIPTAEGSSLYLRRITSYNVCYTKLLRSSRIS